MEHSPMFAYLKDMYLRGKLTEAALDAAVVKGKLTQAEADEIRAARVAQLTEALAIADAATAAELTES